MILCSLVCSQQHFERYCQWHLIQSSISPYNIAGKNFGSHNYTLLYLLGLYQWSNHVETAASMVQGQRAFFKYPSSRVQTRPKPSGFFQGEKILSTPSFGGEVKPSVPCHRFAACKRFLNVTWKSTFRQNYWPTFSPTVPPFAARISHVVWMWRRLAAEVGTSKITGGTRVAQ